MWHILTFLRRGILVSLGCGSPAALATFCLLTLLVSGFLMADGMPSNEEIDSVFANQCQSTCHKELCRALSSIEDAANQAEVARVEGRVYADLLVYARNTEYSWIKMDILNLGLRMVSQMTVSNVYAFADYVGTLQTSHVEEIQVELAKAIELDNRNAKGGRQERANAKRVADMWGRQIRFNFNVSKERQSIMEMWPYAVRYCSDALPSADRNAFRSNVVDRARLSKHEAFRLFDDGKSGGCYGFAIPAAKR